MDTPGGLPFSLRFDVREAVDATVTPRCVMSPIEGEKTFYDFIESEEESLPPSVPS